MQIIRTKHIGMEDKSFLQMKCIFFYHIHEMHKCIHS